MSKGTLFVVTGPSGAGKGTVLGKVLKQIDKVYYSVSATTRESRPGEIDGVHYYFVSKDGFQEMIDNKQLLEYASYAGNYYGTPTQPVDFHLNSGEDVILEIELQGAMQIKDRRKDAIFIFIAPPSLEELESRLRGRGTEDEEHVIMRLEKAKLECAAAKEFNHIVVNDVVDAAVEKMIKIILSYR